MTESKKWVGKDLPLTYNRDPIEKWEMRRWVWGLEDLNPLWFDEAYGKKSLYKSMVASPSFFYSLDYTTQNFRVGHIPNSWPLYVGARWEWSDAARPGDVIDIRRTMLDFAEKDSKTVGPMVIFTGSAAFIRSDGPAGRDGGPHLATCTSTVVRYQPAQAMQRGHKESKPHPEYTREQLEAIQQEKARHTRRGATPRYFEDVNVGEELPTVVNGPHDPMTWARHFTAVRMVMAGDLFEPGDRLAKKQEMGYTLPDPGEVHIRADLGAKVGFPRGYAYGPQMVAWAMVPLTDWMGDTGFLKTLEIRLNLPILLGDVTWNKAKVVSKRVEAGKGLIECQVWQDNQEGQRVGSGSATLVLPVRGQASR